MTEKNKTNREIFLDLCKNTWDFDEKSMEYIEKRTSDEWKFVPEFKKLFEIEGAKVEDQRIRIDIDMTDRKAQKLFENDDQAYSLFKTTFIKVLYVLRERYSCDIQYKEFIENKCIFKKNVTKIKKVFETIYAEDNSIFEADSGCYYDKKICSEWIVKKFEKIGASKKSAKKLQFVISFNPIDWLMSSTSEEWSSCFNINNPSGGFRYCLGIPFLCGDKNRMLLYITNGAKKQCLGLEVDSFQTRTWCILDKSNSMAIVKWYPNDTIGVEPVKSITKVNLFTTNDNFDRSKYDIDILSTKKGAVIGVYSDMGTLTPIDGKLYLVGNNKSGQQVFYKNLIDVTEKRSSSFSFERTETYSSVFRLEEKLGFIIPRWVKYGFHLDNLFATRRCSCCKEDKTGTMLEDGFICYDCFGTNYFTCEKCDRTLSIKTTGKTEIITTSGDKITICSHCAETLVTCSCCGKYSTRGYNKVDDGSKICFECLDTNPNYDTCSSCGKVSKNIKIKYNTFDRSVIKSCSACNAEADDFSFATFGREYRIIFGKKRGIAIE